MTCGMLIREGAAALRGEGIANGMQEAAWLLEHVLGLRSGQAWLAASRDVPPGAVRRFRARIGRRRSGEPLQYILGSVEFHGLELRVGPGVLIPRPETERLVDFAVADYPGQGPVCDLCTGSGAVALALAARLPKGTVVLGTDLAPAALRYARRNRRRLGLRGVRFLEGDLFDPVPRAMRFALVTANPPYVSPRAFARLPATVRDYEPRLALYAGDRGLAVLKRIATAAVRRLAPGGRILCEISSEQGRAARALFEECGLRNVTVAKDYSGRDRIVRAQAPDVWSARAGDGAGGKGREP